MAAPAAPTPKATSAQGIAAAVGARMAAPAAPTAVDMARRALTLGEQVGGLVWTAKNKAVEAAPSNQLNVSSMHSQTVVTGLSKASAARDAAKTTRESSTSAIERFLRPSGSQRPDCFQGWCAITTEMQKWGGEDDLNNVSQMRTMLVEAILGRLSDNQVPLPQDEDVREFITQLCHDDSSVGNRKFTTGAIFALMDMCVKNNFAHWVRIVEALRKDGKVPTMQDKMNFMADTLSQMPHHYCLGKSLLGMLIENGRVTAEVTGYLVKDPESNKVRRIGQDEFDQLVRNKSGDIWFESTKKGILEGQYNGHPHQCAQELGIVHVCVDYTFDTAKYVLGVPYRQPEAYFGDEAIRLDISDPSTATVSYRSRFYNNTYELTGQDPLFAATVATGRTVIQTGVNAAGKAAHNTSQVMSRFLANFGL